MFDTIPDGDVSDHASQIKHDAPIIDAHSALHALSRRNDGTTQDERDGIVSSAATYMPGAADGADDYDDGCSDMHEDY